MPNLNLERKRCAPCEGGMPPLMKKQIDELKGEIETAWEVENLKKLKREFTFKDFKEALGFVNQVGEIAEKEGHHPDITLSWGKVGIELTTHAIQGLSINDFILARKIEILYD